MFKITRFVENIFYIFIDMETPTVYNTYAIIISIGYYLLALVYLLLLLQIEHCKILNFRQRREMKKGNRSVKSMIEMSRKKYASDIKMPKS